MGHHENEQDAGNEEHQAHDHILKSADPDIFDISNHDSSPERMNVLHATTDMGKPDCSECSEPTSKRCI
jgi:formylmethanofuran dehydrogenase subunit E